MKDLQSQHYGAQGVRMILGYDGELSFVVADVCLALGHGNPSAAVAGLDDDEKGLREVDTPGGTQRMMCVTEPGLYKLIARSNKPQAKPFLRWVTHDVLPAIRKTGSYTVQAQEPQHQLPQTLSEALRQYADSLEELEAVKPKAEAYDAFLDSSGVYSVAAVAKSLGYGPNVLFRQLRRLGILQGNNLPYQRYMHHFEVKPGTYRNKSGELVPTATTMVRPSGLEFMRRKLAQAVQAVEEAGVIA